MFLPNSEVESGVLRQGDIVSNIHAFGAVNLGAVNYIVSQEGQQVGYSFFSPPDFVDVMVVSHSCEIDTRNTVKVTSVILAPLRDVNKATRPEKVNELIQSNFVSGGSNYSYLKYFYVERHDKLQYPSGAVVDFSKLFSVRKQSVDLLVANKVAQLNEHAISEMSLKLALYFHRTQPAE